jgi:hypothetical protein
MKTLKPVPKKERTSHSRVRKAFKRFAIIVLGLFFFFDVSKTAIPFLMYISLLFGLYHQDILPWVKRRLVRPQKLLIRSTGANKVTVVTKEQDKKAKEMRKNGVIPEPDREYYLSCGHPVESHGPKYEDCPGNGKRISQNETVEKP